MNKQIVALSIFILLIDVSSSLALDASAHL